MDENRNAVTYRFSRGDKYSCDVVIFNGDTPMFTNIMYPPDTPDEVVETMLNEAEEAALKEHNKALEEAWTS